MPELLYLFFVLFLFVLELIYFRLANYYNIIDHPNDRSSHSEITLLGGGVIFPIAILLHSFFLAFPYPYFIVGLIIISLISFWDDIHTASSKLRMLFHIIAVSLLFQEIGLFNFPIWIVISSYIVLIGSINAYNFMDGINGITGIYSLSVITTLLYLNFQFKFIENNLLVITALALLVFLFFNFRTKAKCFAGDVGSISLAFIILFALTLLIIQTGQFLYILFLAAYGIDSVLTILFRLFKKENIFEPHRSHVYQILCNERGIPHLWVSLIYAAVQLVINLLVIYIIKTETAIWVQVTFALFTLSILSVLYFKIKSQSNE